MSGIEIVGLVLGGFPLLISAAEHYREGFEPLAKWYKFRTQFIAFIDAVDIQKQLFNLTLECFLRSIDIEEDELQRFMEDPGYEGWHRPELFQRLKGRLGPSLGVFKSTIETMNGLMHDLEALLLIKDGQVEWLKEGSSRMDYQMYRLRHSFSKKGTRTVESLKSHNRTLRDLLDSSERLSGMKAKRKDTTWANVFEAIRKHASSVHAALRAGWSCQCAPHTASLRLEQRKTGDWDSSFNLAFGVPQDTQTIVRREVTIKIRKNKAGEATVTKSSVPEGVIRDTANKTQAGLDALRQNFEPKPTSQINVISRPLLTTSASSPPPASTYTSLKSMFRNTSSNGTDCLVEDGHTKTSTKASRLKTRKQARFDAPIDLPVRPVPHTAPSTPQPTPAVQILEIKDFCSIIRSQAINGQCLGFLSDGERMHDVLPFPTDETLDGEAYISLSDILSKQGSPRLSPQKRFKLATILASSLLQLQTTPWLIGNFEKKNIFFYRHGQDISLEHPYVQHSFTKVLCASQSDHELRLAARTSLDNLGILLLELCFGQPIETQEIRKKYLVDGKANPGTDYMTARDWAEMVWEEEPKLEPIIKSCLFCPFEEKPDWRNPQFTQAVYASVVGPLDDYFVSKWP
ncbi:hypothetical protein BKA61DRAFT_279036 [Leptodontidium sp. MPI-SDFR-AT-0119]|nr:hypothetical protein BKA61DRAFT_279036 [Leptodontidium sp. MPI-SDFR-AT-0119]